jgi:hypothetical protein
MKLHYTFLVLSILLSIINQLDIYTSKTAERDSHLHTCKLTQTTGVIVSQLKVNRSRPVSKYIFILLLANAFDIETNPGPRAPKWPCGACKKAVKWNPIRSSICGDNCETWFHIDCQHVSRYMDASNMSWECLNCGIPNFSTALFNSKYSIESDNHLSYLSKNSIFSSPGVPASSPKLPESSRHDRKDIYNVYRRDRSQDGNGANSNHGGDLIAISKEFISSEIKELQTDYEIVWAEINIAGTKKIIIGFYYRPPSDDGKSLDNLDESLNRLNKYHASNIWLGGDFNLDHIDWSVPSFVSGKPEPKLHNQLLVLDIIDDHNLHQTVDKPT